MIDGLDSKVLCAIYLFYHLIYVVVVFTNAESECITKLTHMPILSHEIAQFPTDVSPGRQRPTSTQAINIDDHL